MNGFAWNNRGKHATDFIERIWKVDDNGNNVGLYNALVKGTPKDITVVKNSMFKILSEIFKGEPQFKTYIALDK